MSKRTTAFVRSGSGVRILMQKISLHLTFDEIKLLNEFIASGEESSETAALNPTVPRCKRCSPSPTVIAPN